MVLEDVWGMLGLPMNWGCPAGCVVAVLSACCPEMSARLTLKCRIDYESRSVSLARMRAWAKLCFSSASRSPLGCCVGFHDVTSVRRGCALIIASRAAEYRVGSAGWARRLFDIQLGVRLSDELHRCSPFASQRSAPGVFRLCLSGRSCFNYCRHRP